MLELEVVLEFACCACGNSMGLTLKCAGKSLGAGINKAASVKVPCPNCQAINQVVFTPEDGSLVYVEAADKPRYLLPVPSIN